MLLRFFFIKGSHIMSKEKNLVWIDLEMTGLNPDNDVILEIATIVTDSQLNEIAQGPSLVIYQPDAALQTMDEWVFQQHTQSGLVQHVQESKISIVDAQKQTVDFLALYCTPGTAPLCGNSVWQDKAFLRRYMPELNKFFHYRIIDVSTLKELAVRWYPQIPEINKKDAHRALDDIRESIEELRYYRQHIFV